MGGAARQVLSPQVERVPPAALATGAPQLIDFARPGSQTGGIVVDSPARSFLE